MFLFPPGEPLHRVKATTLWCDANEVPCLNVRVCENLLQVADLFTCVVFYFLHLCPSIASMLVFVYPKQSTTFQRTLNGRKSFFGLEGPMHFICRICVLNPTHMQFSDPLHLPPRLHPPTFIFFTHLLGHFSLLNPFCSAESVEQKSRQ